LALQSRYLQELHQCSPESLSINFNVDRYNGDRKESDFTLGRIVGSIGPHSANEPKHFVPGRQLAPNSAINGAPLNYATAVVNETNKTITIDLGNSLQFGAGDLVAEKRDLYLAVATGDATNPYSVISPILYESPDWYNDYAGITAYPLSDAQFKLLTQQPLAVITPAPSKSTNQPKLTPSNTLAVMQEVIDYVVADKFVHYLNPGEKQSFDIYTTKLGQPLPHSIIQFAINSSLVGGDPDSPPPCVPESAIQFPGEITTDINGKAQIYVSGSSPNNPRSYIDGQVYAITYYFKGTDFSAYNQFNYLSLLLFNSLPQAKVDNPSWDDLAPIMQQYANLYPIMSKGIFNLADKTTVDNNASILKLAFGKDREDPNYMPATRDLSADKQRMILNYLQKIIDSAHKAI
jgi:hypothetical protein